MHDERLVQLALARGYVTPEQVARARAEQRALADRGIEHSLYFILQDLGFLREEDARELRRSTSSSVQRALEVEGFIIQGRLGSGGMGDVFRAAHPDGRVAAIKLLSGRLAKNEEYVRRFQREARAMQRLDHPHVVRVLSVGECFGTHYIMMEFVDGSSLKTHIIEHGPLDERGALTILVQMASALRHAWQHGVLHRDVKPANILLAAPRPQVTEPFCAKLCDFGLARLHASAADPDLSRGDLTGTGLALGTPHYMSPEQATGEADIDQRADIYGLGATLYHAMLGRTMFSGKSSAVIMYKQVTESVNIDDLRQAGFSEPLVSLLASMLKKRREERIASWDAVLEAACRIPGAPAPPSEPPLDQAGTSNAPALLDAPVAGSQASTTSHVRRPRRAWRSASLIAAFVILLSILLTGLWLLGSRVPVVRNEQELSEALREPRSEILLHPGQYRTTLQLGAIHQGLRLRALANDAILAGDPAILCSPGLQAAELHRLEIASPGTAIATVGGSHLTLRDARIRGMIDVRGSSVRFIDCIIDGQVQANDRARIEMEGCRINGRIDIVRGDLRLAMTRISGRVHLSDGRWEAAGVWIDSHDAMPALALTNAVATCQELVVQARGTALQARHSELPICEGLTVSGNPAIDWQGVRREQWLWQRFAVFGEVLQLPGPLPPGPGADQQRLPP
ncbi:MAG: serine/threonine-protein kinase [Planctomycetota bacterium]|nr:serine/threonine-protein kinase [Planctomycetota bacterium]